MTRNLDARNEALVRLPSEP